MHKFDIDIDIDICGSCNLRCPSCPQGNVRGYRLPQGFMEPELLERIVAKAKAECRKVQISLYNWAEPLLHPRLTELIRIVQESGIPCHLSSNLNLLPNADAIMAANPASLRISNSGFSQEVYGRSHRGGNIERVKQHMAELAAAKSRQHADTEISVYYHRYLHNLQEVPLMREFSKDLGFHFHPVWALFFPLEKILDLASEKGGDYALTDEDQALICDLALPLPAALVASRKYRDRPCPLRENAISLDFQGNVTLCCGIFDAGKYTVGNYMDLPLGDIQKIRQSHPLCELCLRQGAHVYMTYGIDEIDELALANIPAEEVDRLDLRREIAWERRQERLTKLYGRYFSRLFSSGQKAALADRYFRLQRFLSRLRSANFGKG